MSDPRIENQILVLLACPSLDLTTAERVRDLLKGNVDWDYLVETAERHASIPLLFRHLATTFQPDVPARVMSRLHDLDQENTRTSLLFTGELIKLIDFLAAEDIQAIPFKGPALAALAYGDLALRQFGDLDVLVKREDLPKVKSLLAAQGFAPRPKLNPTQELAVMRFDCSHNFANEKLYVDLHWAFTPRYFSFEVTTARLWARLRPVTFGGREVMTLSAEDMLLVICLHGLTHSWERLGWISDVAALTSRQKTFDWDLVLSEAIRTGNRRVLSLGLFLASEVLNAPVPAEVWKSLPADATVRAIAEQCQSQLFAQRQVNGIAKEIRLHLSMREGKRDKLKSLFHLLATPRPNDWKSLSLPPGLFFLYYPLRPLRLAGKFGARLLNGSSGEA